MCLRRTHSKGGANGVWLCQGGGTDQKTGQQSGGGKDRGGGAFGVSMFVAGSLGRRKGDQERKAQRGREGPLALPDCSYLQTKSSFGDQTSWLEMWLRQAGHPRPAPSVTPPSSVTPSLPGLVADEFQDSGLRLHPARGSSAPMPRGGSSPGEKGNQPRSDTERGGGPGGEEELRLGRKHRCRGGPGRGWRRAQPRASHFKVSSAFLNMRMAL